MRGPCLELGLVTSSEHSLLAARSEDSVPEVNKGAASAGLAFVVPHRSQDKGRMRHRLSNWWKGDS